MVIWKLLRRVHLLIPEELLAEVDEAAKEKWMSRSEFIRYALDEKVHGKFEKTMDKLKSEDPARFADADDS